MRTNQQAPAPTFTQVKRRDQLVQCAIDAIVELGYPRTSVAEVAHHELWQRCGLTAAFVAREARAAEELAERAEQWLSGQEWELVRSDLTLISPDD